MKTIRRSGRYYRVCDPGWFDCCDTTFSEQFGGRWNSPGTFPVLYLNADVATARANAQHRYDGEAFGLFDLNPTARPHLQIVAVASAPMLDIVTDVGTTDAGLPVTYPVGVTHAACRKIGTAAHKANVAGIACRSAALPGGEELALLHLSLATKGERQTFDDWFFPRTTSGSAKQTV